MTYEYKIKYMMQALQIALDELNYVKEYKEKGVEAAEKNQSWAFYNYNRTPNMTLVRENLKTVGRLAYIVEKEIPKKIN